MSPLFSEANNGEEMVQVGFRQRLAIGYLPASFTSDLSNICKAHGRIAAKRKNKIVGLETQNRRYEILLLSFKQLRGMGFKFETPRNLKRKHVDALVDAWVDCCMSPSTLANRLSVLRIFCGWIGKPNMVGPAEDVVRNPKSVRREQVAKFDKSWSSHGVNIDIMIATISAHDWRVGIQVKLIRAFGLRMREAVMFKPLKAVDLVMRTVTIRDGTKGGRERTLSIRKPEQMRVLEEAMIQVTSLNQSLSHPDMDLTQAINRFRYVIRKYGVTKSGMGVTIHGLRHEYLNDMYFELTGTPSPVRSAGLQVEINALEHALASEIISHQAGHARKSITSAYIGSASAVRKGKAERLGRLEELMALMAKRLLNDRERAEFTSLIEVLIPDMLASKDASSRLLHSSSPR